MPKLSAHLPANSSFYGIWISRPTDKDDGDTHLYINKELGAVIGQNLRYNDNVNFSDMALCLKDRDEAIFQYAGAKGEPHHVKLPMALVGDEIERFLSILKGKALEIEAAQTAS